MLLPNQSAGVNRGFPAKASFYESTGSFLMGSSYGPATDIGAVYPSLQPAPGITDETNACLFACDIAEGLCRVGAPEGLCKRVGDNCRKSC